MTENEKIQETLKHLHKEIQQLRIRLNEIECRVYY